MTDPLDSLAPAPSAPASSPAPSAAPPAPPPSPSASPSPSAAPSAAPAPVAAAQAATGAPPALDGPALLQALATQLNIPADELRESLEVARRARAEAVRREEYARRTDPGYQQAARRGEALRTLVAEGYSPEVARALESLPDFADYLHAQRADGADRDLTEALQEIGITFDDSAKSQELKTEWTDTLVDRINANPKLVQRYNGTPAERRAVIRELVGKEERRLNDVLLRQNAATLRQHASRSASARPGRAAAALPPVRQESPTATDPLQRRREANAIAGRQLDDIFAYHS